MRIDLKYSRPPEAEPGSLDSKEAGARVRLSRKRLAASDLGGTVRAWRLWAVCVEATASYGRAADLTFATALAKRAGIPHGMASKFLRQFDELGVFQWPREERRGDRKARLLALPGAWDVATLPSHEGGDVATLPSHESAARGHRVAPLHNLEMSVVRQDSQGGGGTPQGDGQHAPGATGVTSQASGQEASHPSADDVARTVASLEADLGPIVAERFAPYHADERTSDSTGDDEAAQVRHQVANPSKTRAKGGQS